MAKAKSNRGRATFLKKCFLILLTIIVIIVLAVSIYFAYHKSVTDSPNPLTKPEKPLSLFQSIKKIIISKFQ